ncbi:MAG: M14 family zinc carboxypeptidase [Pseudoxanthomonas suwonensis]|nr:M14 family zinc carboxypeptidase [Pseudoxanthomonas suwonensis]
MPTSRLFACALAAALATTAVPAHADDSLHTEAERSGFAITGRYAEVERLCDAFQQAYPRAVRCFQFGTTPQGLPMKAMAVSTSGALTPGAAKQRGLPVVLAQGGIHAGEIDGKDAVFWMLREWLGGHAPAGVLEAQVLLFVPVFNVDGHENFRAWHRPNQRGPEQMGFRATAQRYNLNRDYVKADSPEMVAMLGLIDQWDPLLLLDLHATNGAQFQHDISITGEPMHAGVMQPAGRALRDGIIAGLKADGHLPVDFYPSFVESDNPASGFAEGVMLPRFSTSYLQVRQRIGILVETHSWRPYPQRVQSTRRTVEHALRLVADNASSWLALAADADRQAAGIGGRDVTMTWKVVDEPATIDFLGYAYTVEPSEISGGSMIRYDETTPQVWKVPLRNKVTPDLVLPAPAAGYVVPAAWADVIRPKLQAHGIEHRTVGRVVAGQPARSWVASDIRFAPATLEGHQRLSANGEWQGTRVDIAAGDVFVPIAQPRSWLLMHLLEPQSPDSLAAWGFMNTAFERKEYMEAYVTESEARRMLQDDAALKARFEARLRDDPEFAASPRTRLDFFYRNHPAWDHGFGRYPVLQVDHVPGG